MKARRRKCRSSCLHSLARVRLGEAVDCVACHVYTEQRAGHTGTVQHNRAHKRLLLARSMRDGECAAVARMQDVCKSYLVVARVIAHTRGEGEACSRGRLQQTGNSQGRTS